MQLEAYLQRDDRIVLPIGSTEQHAYLSLATDNILAERVAVEAAEPLGVLVLPVLPYGITPRFAAYPGSPTLRVVTFLAVVTDLLESLSGQGFRRILIVNGHGGNVPARMAVSEWGAEHPETRVLYHDWWNSKRVMAIGDSVRTDLRGARAFGIDMLFMAAGIHAEEFGGRDTPNKDAMKTVFAAAGEMPTAVMRHLVW